MSAPATPPLDMRPTGAHPPEGDEIERLRAEVSTLRAQLDVHRRRRVTRRGLRIVVSSVLAVAAAFGFVASVVGLWAANTTLNTDRWVATVAPLPKDPKVAAAVATYTTDQVFRLVDVEQRLREALPQPASFLAGPVTGQVRAYVQKTVNNVLQTDAFQRIWIEANRRAHERALSILEGTSDVVAVHGQRVTIDLLPVINQALREVSDALPTLFGHQITLPDLSSGAVPDNLRAIVANATGVTLPANFAQFTLYDAGRLRAVQLALVQFKRDVVLLVLSTVVLLAGALGISVRRRRTVLQLGLWLMVAAVTVTAVVRVSRAQLVALVPAGVYRDGVSSAIGIVGSSLRARGVQILWLGAILAAIAYLVGPGRFPRWGRERVRVGGRAVARFAAHGTRPALGRLAGWIGRYRDPLRVVGVVAAVLLALLLSSWTGLLVTAAALAGYELVVTLVARRAVAPATDRLRTSP